MGPIFNQNKDKFKKRDRFLKLKKWKNIERQFEKIYNYIFLAQNYIFFQNIS